MEFTMGGVRGGCMAYYLSGFGSMGLCDILLEALVPTIQAKMGRMLVFKVLVPLTLLLFLSTTITMSRLGACFSTFTSIHR